MLADMTADFAADAADTADGRGRWWQLVRQHADQVRPRLLLDPNGPAPDLNELLSEAMREGTHAGESAGSPTELVQAVRAELWGWGPLTPYLSMPGLSDLIVTGKAQVWADSGPGLQRVGDLGLDVQQLRRLCVQLSDRSGARLDDAHPWADGVGEFDGQPVRLHALLPPLSDGPQLSLRLLRLANRDWQTLRASGSIDVTSARVLNWAMAAGAHLLIAGSTGAGKTSLLAALLSRLPQNHRILSIEDTPELTGVHPHLISLRTREPNVEGRGAVHHAQLLRQALRMRPDHLVLGECRGAELPDFLQALNTGHHGMGTLHANSASEVPARLAGLAMSANLPAEAALSMARTAFDLIIYVHRQGPRRWVRELACWGPDGDCVTVLHRDQWQPATGPVVRVEPQGRAALNAWALRRGHQPVPLDAPTIRPVAT